MTGRDPEEAHRAATPLELLFDLCFVVAVSQAATQLAHAVAEDHVGSGLVGYAMVFFAIWWAWMNFTWFASAYDTDDASYRVLTLLQMAGVLVLAAGVPSALNTYDFTVITFGYVLMRIAMVLQWLRAAREDPVGRPAAVRYAIGVGVVQVGWLVRLALPHPLDYVGFAVLVVGELAVPVWAEFRGGATTWHREHIAERYGLFSIIVLGEVILASTTAVETGLSEHGVSASLLLIAIGGLLLVFAMWWIYFTGRRPELARLPTALVWGYGHYAVFAAVAALGAGLEVAIETAEHRTEVSPVTAALAVALPVAVFLVVVASLHRLARTGADRQLLLGGSGAVAVLVLAGAAPLVGLGGAVLLMGVVLAGMVGVNLVLAKPG